jgi:hypothetical protein
MVHRKSFENWTHTSSTILGTVFLWLDFSVPTRHARRIRAHLPDPAAVGQTGLRDARDRYQRAHHAVRLLVSAEDSGGLRPALPDPRAHDRLHRQQLSGCPAPLRAEVSPRNQPEALDTIIDGAPGEKSS